ENTERLPHDHGQVIARRRKEILCDSANDVSNSHMPPHRDEFDGDAKTGMEARLLYVLSEPHVVYYFQRQFAMRSSGFIRGAAHKLESADADVRTRTRIFDAGRIRYKIETEAKECERHVLPESSHYKAAHERQVIQLASVN